MTTTMRLSKKRIAAFQKKILTWWFAHRRDLPWRRTHDPYRIMVSEVMLQQTQVSRVLPKYKGFLRVFPTVVDLAKATPAHVLRVWKGMGYNRRALYLHHAAKIIVEQYQSQFPVSEQQLSKLPGLGTYTARAILVFAYKQEVPLVDTNIRKIITHFFFHDVRQKESVIETVAQQLLPKGKSWQWHQALMDYGALAMTNIQIPMTNWKKQKPFKDSNRYYRGRIIDQLREGDIVQKSLLKELGGKYAKPAAFFQSILRGLEADGLITRQKTGIITLPE